MSLYQRRYNKISDGWKLYNINGSSSKLTADVKYVQCMEHGFRWIISKWAITPTLTTSAAQYWPVRDHGTLTAYKPTATVGSPLCETAGQWWDRPTPSNILMSSVLSISAVWMGHHTPAGILSFQRASLTDVSNCFGAIPLISFVWVCVCVFVLTISRAEGEDGMQERQRHRDKVRPPYISVCW